ncbi:hypothetical protein [Aquibacillus albus]|uniref:DUF3899 domain-containing protein n=1 Tax=Aquibacillus albus TaxID=1168171 RepID=A0ABS2MX30_9BACI|nr:hypothetical protein [Aquibacillus albus]MBM7570440.1 hypothetical protein [Aquibacillus albus]
MIFIGFILLIGFVVLDFYLFRIIFRSFFDDTDHFFECLKLDFRPNIISFFKGELRRDWAAEFRIGMFFFVCIIILIFEFLILRGFFQ